MLTNHERILVHQRKRSKYFINTYQTQINLRKIMSLTPSAMLPLGSKAPDFTLLEPKTGVSKSLQQLKGQKATVVMFICNHCPFVIHLEQALTQLGRDYHNSGVSVIAISANDANSYHEDGPEYMAKKAIVQDYRFPYLYDESQLTAKAYKATCTPDFFLFDQELSCVYRGQFDDSRPGNNKKVTGNDLRQAIYNVVTGRGIDEKQYPSNGCNIKWKVA